jgi:type I restriction enzyme M protein
VDASKGFIKEGTNNKLRASDIKRIADAVRDRENRPKFSRVVTREEIRSNEYNLNIPRYVDSAASAAHWDIYASMFGGIPVKELEDFNAYWDAFPGLRDYLFENTTPVNARLKVENIKESITKHESVSAFAKAFKTSFSTHHEFLKTELLSQVETVNISKEKILLSNDIFNRLNNIALIDKYEAYQLLDDNWDIIKVDLEIIQTESFDSARTVDPHLVVKKVKGKEQEVQEGWQGRILPFTLVQELLLKEQRTALSTKENRLLAINAAYNEVLEQFTEDEKEEETVNEAQTGFVNSKIIKEAKSIRAERKSKKPIVSSSAVENVLAVENSLAVPEANSYEQKILTIDRLLTEEKKLKKQVKDDEATLHLLTKETIENLTDTQVYELLEQKWITPMVEAMNQLPIAMIDTLARKLNHLKEKYATTYSQVAKDISKAENALADLLDDLTGNEYDMEALSEFKNLLKSKA